MLTHSDNDLSPVSEANTSGLVSKTTHKRDCVVLYLGMMLDILCFNIRLCARAVFYCFISFYCFYFVPSVIVFISMFLELKDLQCICQWKKVVLGCRLRPSALNKPCDGGSFLQPTDIMDRVRN